MMGRKKLDQGNVGIGIVGANFGRAFQFHLHPHCRVVAVCDMDTKAAEAAVRDMRLTEYDADCLLAEKSESTIRQSLEECTVYAVYEEMLKDERVDAVAVFTPAPLHAEMSCRAMESGRHVLSAVPAALTLEECDRLVQTAQRTGLNYMMAETSYFYPHIMTLRRWHREERKMGVLFHSEAEYIHYAPQWGSVPGDPKTLEEEQKDWRFGLPPGYYSTHSTSGIIAVTGERLVQVSALGTKGVESPARNRYDNPFANLVAFFKTSGGHSARVCTFWYCAWGAWATRFGFYGTQRTFLSRHGHEGEFGQDVLKVIDENGKETTRPFPPEFFFHQLPRELLPPEGGHYHSHPFITHEFVSSIVEERPPEIDVYEAVAYTAPGLVAHQSALKEGEWMKIPDFGSRPQRGV